MERISGKNGIAARQAVVVDLGAGSGRVMHVAGGAEGAASLRELHRFDDFEAEAEGGPAWDLDAIMDGVLTGLERAARLGPATIGIDSWGLDFGMVGAGGALVAPVLHYRHPRSMRGHARTRLPEAEVVRLSGGQALPCLTLYQLAEEVAARPARIASTAMLLPIAALVSWRLTGRAAVERSLARTTGLHDPRGDAWHPELLAAAGIRADLLPPVVEAGTVLGPLRPGLPGAGILGPVIATASHDTAAAVAGLAPGPEDAFLVAGSWNLLGWTVEAGAPDPEALAAGFGCEGGVGGRAFMVRSLNGLHLMRRLRAAWARRHGDLPGWQELGAAAEAAPPGPVVDTEAPAFFDAADMVAAAAAATGLREDDLGGLARAITDGMAARVAEGVERITALRGRRPARLVVGGGGVRDAVFLRSIERATGLEAVRGPVEASATGNALVQFAAAGARG